MDAEKCARAWVASPLLREELFERPATGTKGANCSCTLSVVGRTRSRTGTAATSATSRAASFDFFFFVD